MIYHRVVKNILFGSVALIAGCCCAESQLDNNWGRSYEAAKYNQIRNPEAEKNSSPVTGLEGQVGERIMKKHIKGEADKKSSRKGFGLIEIK